MLPQRKWVAALAFMCLLIVLRACSRDADRSITALQVAAGQNPGFNDDLDQFTVFVGVLTTSSRWVQRQTIRASWQLWPALHSQKACTRFILGDWRDATPEVQRFLAWENSTHGDLVMLFQRENLENGKTHNYFSWLGVPGLENTYGRGCKCSREAFTFAMKADDDTFIHLANLVNFINTAPPHQGFVAAQVLPSSTYWGFQCWVGPVTARKFWHCGGGYLLSWNLVSWILSSAWVKNHTVGHEDQVTASWLHHGVSVGDLTLNVACDRDRMYDLLGTAPSPFPAHELVPDTIYVHRVKDLRRWPSLLAYFLSRRPVTYESWNYAQSDRDYLNRSKGSWNRTRYRGCQTLKT